MGRKKLPPRNPLKIYQLAVNGLWYWGLKTEAGNSIATSGRGYKSQQNAMRGALAALRAFKAFEQYRLDTVDERKKK